MPTLADEMESYRLLGHSNGTIHAYISVPETLVVSHAPCTWLHERVQMES
jgi:hypothetical protein